MTVKRYNPIGIPGEVMQPDECGGFVGWADHDALQHQNQHLLTCTKNAGRRIESLEAECLALKEHCAALESREVCTVAHENVETCGYCQRDGLERLLKRGIVFALNCEFDPNQPLGFRQKAAAWLDAVSVAIGMGRPDDSCDHTWVDTGRCNKCGLAYEKWIGDDAFCEEGCLTMGAHAVCATTAASNSTSTGLSPKFGNTTPEGAK